VVDIWSRKVVAWDVEQSESAELAAQLVSRACLKERINSCRSQPLILHADNGSSIRGATLEVRLEELGVLRSFSRPRVSNDNRYSEPLGTGLTIPTGLSAAKKKPANGFPHLLIGITTNTAIAASNLLRLSKGIAVRLLRSAASGHAFMS